MVLTGAFERIDAGIELVADGTTDRLFISGANPGAGIRPERFAAQFGANHPGLGAMLECCIEFGVVAGTTIENALETRCWLGRRPSRGPLIVVTTSDHMPRALAAMRGFVAREVVALAVARLEGSRGLKSRLEEYLKWLSTVVLVRLPEPLLARSGLYGPFAQGCKEAAR